MNTVARNHKIVSLMVFCLAATSCMNYRNSNKQTVETKQTVIQPPQNFDWNNASVTEAFKAGEIQNLDDFVQKAPHVTDTIIVTKDNYKGRLCAGIYIPREDKVHLKYFIPDLTDCTPAQERVIIASVRKWNDEVAKMADKAHEYHHRYIHKKGVFSMHNSAEDYAKLCAHNEIAAYTVTFLYEREIVKRAIWRGLPSTVWRKIISSRFSEYWDAVEQGKVRLDNILLNNEQKDNLLISKTVFNWWMKHEYNKNVHVSSQRIKNYMNNNKWAINYPRNPENYEKALNICYTFLKDGKIVNLNRFFKQNIKMTFGISEFPFGTEVGDIDNQPEVKELIAQIRNTPGNTLYSNQPPKKYVKVKKIIKVNQKSR